MPLTISQRVDALKQAFLLDKFAVVNWIEYEGQLGIEANSTEAFNRLDANFPKKAYYLEGSNYQMGYMLGKLAEPAIAKMTTDYVDRVIESFFNGDKVVIESELKKIIENIMIDLVIVESKKMRPDIPVEYCEELDGIAAGCKAAHAQTKVTPERLWALNYGIDCLLAHLFTGTLFKDKISAIALNLPVMCNAFSISGAIVKDGKHYFGRQFMFPTAHVMQDYMCMIVCRPAARNGRQPLPIVNQTAPGIVGSVAAMNTYGLAIGIEMSPSMLSNPARPGFNSLGLNRDLMHYCQSLDDVSARLQNTQRGVSWIYAVAQGNSAGDAAAMFETGQNIGDAPFPYLDFVDANYAPVLPDLAYILAKRQKYGTPAPQKGIMARNLAYTYPGDYLAFNAELWKKYNKTIPSRMWKCASDLFAALKSIFTGFKLLQACKDIWKALQNLFKTIAYDPSQFGERGYIDSSWLSQQCPGPFYFSPQRETRADLVLATNHFITPEMRLTAMTDWICNLMNSQVDDMQWRYDELNHQLLDAIAQAEANLPIPIDEGKAWKLIDFLNPDPASPLRLYNNPDGLDLKDVVVHGSVNLFDLHALKLTSLFGYYSDKTVTIHLNNYLL